MKLRPVPAVARAAAILRLLGDSETALGVQAIARAGKIIPSTCLHILRQLVVEGLVEFDEDTKRYALSPRILALADKMLRRTPMAHALQPALDRLTRKCPVSAALMQITDRDRMVVIGMSNRSGLGLKVELGTMYSPLNSATGRCLAGFGEYSAEDLKSRFRLLKWARPLPFRTWRAEAAAAAERGYGVDRGHYLLGITVISAPILDTARRIGHTVVAFGISEQIERFGLERIAAELKAVAAPFSAGSRAVERPR